MAADNGSVRRWFRQLRAYDHGQDARRLDAIQNWIRSPHYPPTEVGLGEWTLHWWFRHDRDHYAVLGSADIYTHPLIFLFPVVMSELHRNMLRNRLHAEHDLARRTRGLMYRFAEMLD